ncbi:4'-phosphopantetheinyl transferase family protein [Facilibium subflavum]|uniref:4'-phosphopantetheinyl transferase family protein n=1 Tax=Facilibium subflavum TaxID=2219058 RepID=UPI000E649CBA|nr:4'-phosphopantetheinyl transferase superfamily protein [Facilibium subflavum]
MVDIYQVSLPLFDEEAYISQLPQDIIQRAASYKLARKRKEFIASQWIRYQVLSQYLSCDPEKILFETTDKGRPFIKGAIYDFNISHTKDYVVLAIAKNQRVGIDVQSMKESIDALAIAKQYFSIDEYQWLSALPEDERYEGFYHLWTLKEASLKLTGQGIANGLCQYDFAKDHNRLNIVNYPDTHAFFYQSLKIDDHTLLSIAAEKNIEKIHHFLWQDDKWAKRKGCCFS